MFNPAGVELSAEEELNLIKNKQEITFENTRLRLNPFNEVQSKETINELAKTQAKVLTKISIFWQTVSEIKKKIYI